MTMRRVESRARKKKRNNNNDASVSLWQPSGSAQQIKGHGVQLAWNSGAGAYVWLVESKGEKEDGASCRDCGGMCWVEARRGRCCAASAPSLGVFTDHLVIWHVATGGE